MTLHLPEVVFLDLEASSLAQDGWPIEIGLTWIDELDELVSWASLIRPHASWPPERWCPQSEALHGIEREDLKTASVAEDVAQEVLRMIAGRTMVAEAPKSSRSWLDQLLAVADLERETAVLDFDAIALRTFEGEALDRLYASLTRRRAPNRAGPDSRRLARAWQRGLEALHRAPEAA